MFYRYECIRIALCIAFTLVVFGSTARAQQEAYRPTVMIDIDKLSDSARATIITSLIKLKKIEEWEKYSVEKGDSLSKIIYDNYGYADTKYPKTAEALKRSIVEANNLNDPSSIIAGQQIRIPKLPTRPYSRGAQRGLAQLLDTRFNALFLTSLPGAVSMPKASPPVVPESLQKGDSWIINMSAQENELFLAGIPAEVRDEVVGDELYSGPTIQVEEFTVPEASDFSSAQPAALTAQQAVSTFLSGITPQAAGKLYVLDFFKPVGTHDCTHGDMVVDVVRQTLEGYGAGQLVGNIQPIQIDFFENKDAASAIIREYISSFSSEKNQKNLTAALDNLRGQKKPKPDKKYVPLLYLQALYHTLTSKPDTAVVTSSFFIRFDGYRVIPIEYHPDNKVPLLSAVMDDVGSKVEEVQTEPQKSFYDARRDLGVILVGAEKEPGTSYGMISQAGDGVTCLARGAGWGGTNSCITPQKIGTSFSTPLIAVQMFLARAFWAANSMDISAKEAKIRLLLASDLNPSYVQNYASGGVPRLEKLLRPNGAFAETADGAITDVSLAGSFIDVKAASGDIPDRFNFQRGTKGFCGIQVADGRVFIFREAAMRWEEVEVVSFSFTVRENGTTRPLSLEEFKSRYKEMAVL